MILNPFLLERAYNETRRLVSRDKRASMRKRRYNALKKAYQRLIENPYINYENGSILILSDTVTEQGEAKFYRTSAKECRLEEPDNVLCFAFWEGNPCWHRATLEIVENYLLIENEFNQESNSKSVHAVNTSVSPA
ncbi:MAG TPA: hypothetical protein PKY82_21945 [Pyrinomonadaceae bacterium]|nr:hypothetical protein [Pyrinomonadaceae bacterium]